MFPFLYTKQKNNHDDGKNVLPVYRAVFPKHLKNIITDVTTHTHFFPSLEPANEALQPAQDDDTWEQFMGPDITSFHHAYKLCDLKKTCISRPTSKTKQRSISNELFSISFSCYVAFLTLYKTGVFPGFKETEKNIRSSSGNKIQLGSANTTT